MIPVRRLNHAVLYIRDVERSVAFYQDAFGFEIVDRMPGQAAFLRAAGSANHHDLGLFALGPNAPGPEPGRVGLYHLAWEVGRIEDLADAADTLQRLGALAGASDHGATKSLYGKDPDGNEFEVMWAVPRDEWGDDEQRATTQPLDMGRELARFGGGTD
jgi:catechol-2,3-dioxygenase